MDDASGQTINISKVLTSGTGAGGYLSQWASASQNSGVLSETPLYWISTTGSNPGVLFATSSISLASRQNINNHRVSNNVFLLPNDGTQAIGVTTHGDYSGGLASSGAFKSTRIIGAIDGWPSFFGDWSNGVGPSDPISIKGLNLVMDNTVLGSQQTYFTKNGTAYGIYSDVSNVAIQSVGDRGYRLPGVFMGGGVGIGGTPSAELEVKGTVISSFFQISDGLVLSTLNVVNGAFSILNPNRVAIGSLTPSVELAIGGAVSANALRSVTGIKTNTFSSVSGGFAVPNTGFVGIGTTTPDSLFDLRKEFTAPIDEPYSFYNIEIISSDNGRVLVPVTAIGITLNAVNSGSSIFGNRLGSATKAATGYGIKIDYSLELNELSTLGPLTLIKNLGIIFKFKYIL
jgi:hypothetical protein